MENKFIVEKFVNRKTLLPSETSDLFDKFSKLIMYSVTASTWKKHMSAWNSLKNFCEAYDIKLKLPLNVQYARAFCTWMITVKNLKQSTIENYLSSITVIHNLGGLQCENFMRDRCIASVLKGGTNISFLYNPKVKIRLAMNIHLLKILAYRIAETKWDPMSKQIIWTACTVSFYSSCRMGEILSEQKNCFDPKTTLKWENIFFIPENEVLLQIPYTKTTGLKGTNMYLFPLDNDTCPVSAITKLHEFCQKNDLKDKIPVFTFKTGVHLTVNTLNNLLDKLLYDFNDDSQKISCHSFRSAIPSAIASNPDKITTRELMDWGKWHSDSYKKYTKIEKEKEKITFYKVVDML